jgi:glutathione S-transferase
MIHLHHFALSPFCRKVRLALAEKKLVCTLIDEPYWERDPEFMRLNPAGEVPVLRTGQLVLADSTAICEWPEETHPDPALLPGDAAARAEIRRLVGWFDGVFHREVTARLVHERVVKKVTRAGYPDGRAVKEGAKSARFHLDYMGWLLDQRRWLAGDALSLADFAAAAHVSCLDYSSDVDWNHNEGVRDWYSKIKSRPAFRSILADQVPGFRPAPHYADLDF